SQRSCSHASRPPRLLHSFPTRRSSDLYARVDAEHRQCRGRRAERIRREAHRHDAAARKAVAPHSGPSTRLGPGRTVVISSPFDYSRATSLDDALAKLKASNGEGKFIAG